MPVALKEAAQAGAGEDVGDVEQRFGLAVRAEFAFVTHEVGQHTGAVSAEDDDGLAAQIALEGLTHGTGFVMGAHQLGQYGRQFDHLRHPDARNGQVDEGVEQSRQRCAGLAHGDVGELLQGIALVFGQDNFAHSTPYSLSTAVMVSALNGFLTKAMAPWT
jgi:hypothetical protein